MIFFDATGKRWRRIKLSAAGVTVLAVAPVALLGIGAVVYQPKWGQLPGVSQAQNFIDQAASIASQQVAAATHPAPTPSPAAPSPAKPVGGKTTNQSVAKATGTSISGATTPMPTAAVLSAHTSTNPHATSTPVPTASPSAAPGNSGGHAKSTHSPNH